MTEKLRLSDTNPKSGSIIAPEMSSHQGHQETALASICEVYGISIHDRALVHNALTAIASGLREVKL